VTFILVFINYLEDFSNFKNSSLFFNYCDIYYLHVSTQFYHLEHLHSLLESSIYILSFLIYLMKQVKKLFAKNFFSKIHRHKTALICSCNIIICENIFQLISVMHIVLEYPYRCCLCCKQRIQSAIGKRERILPCSHAYSLSAYRRAKGCPGIRVSHGINPGV